MEETIKNNNTINNNNTIKNKIIFFIHNKNN